MPELHAAIVTPLTASNQFDAPAMVTLMRHLEICGLDGIVPCGTTGEGPSFSVSQRLDIISTCVQQRGKLGVIAGTGCQSLADTINLTQAGLAIGADAALVLPPFFYKQAGEAGVIAWYQQLCDALPLASKIILYHIPPLTGVAITPTIIDALRQSHPNYIYGIKDSGVNAAHTAMLVATYPTLKIYTGNAPILDQAISAGASGSILAIANIAPRSLRQLTDNPIRSDIQIQLASVDSYVRKVGAVATIKAILNQAGLTVGLPMAPQLAHPDAAQAYAEFQAIGEYTE